MKKDKKVCLLINPTSFSNEISIRPFYQIGYQQAVLSLALIFLWTILLNKVIYRHKSFVGLKLSSSIFPHRYSLILIQNVLLYRDVPRGSGGAATPPFQEIKFVDTMHFEQVLNEKRRRQEASSN